MWDVIIVGAGPGGSAAAKLCANAGLRTLILEKKKLPREKVCSGLLSGATAISLTREIFGELPETILTDPFYLKGAIIHVNGADPETIETRMPTAWRKDLDYWMTQKAQDQGAEIFDSANVLNIEEERETYKIIIEHENERKKLITNYIIGADGANSSVRKKMFPDFKVHYKQSLRECYKGSIPGLDRQYIHIFPHPWQKFVFLINHKGDSFTLETSGRLREVKKLRDLVARPFLADNYLFNHEKRFLWRDGCLEVMLSKDLISGSFFPARGNILLIGDAAGFQLPTSEGIGTALRSASISSNSILESIRTGKEAGGIYLNQVRNIIDAIKSLAIKSKYDLSKDPKAIAEAIKNRLLALERLSY